MFLSFSVSQTQAECCRYAVGSILSEDEEKPDEELQRLYEKFGFRVISFPEVSCAVTSSFPNRCPLAPICGAYRVFPELNAYIMVSAECPNFFLASYCDWDCPTSGNLCMFWLK